MKYSGFILQVYKLIICRKAASRHPKTASPSQKPTSTSHKTVSQAVSTYRHPIHQFFFTDGEEKWTAYKFTRNVYDTWMAKLHKLICSGINDLPAGINFDLSQSASFPQSTPQRSQQSNVESTLGEGDSQSSLLASQEVTPTTSVTQTNEPAFNKPRNKRATDWQR